MGEIISVHVKPGSRESRIIGFDKDNVLRVEVRAQAQDGKANLEMVKMLSKRFERKIRIKSGMGSKNKLIEIL
jgi:uncharacterized protein (TIGR00251 family)